MEHCPEIKVIVVVKNKIKKSWIIYFVGVWLVDGSSAFWLMVTFVKRLARLLLIGSDRAICSGCLSSVVDSESECFLLLTKSG